MIRLEQIRGEMLERFERTDRRFVQNEQRLGRIDQRLAEITERIDALRQEILEQRELPAATPQDASWHSRRVGDQGAHRIADADGPHGGADGLEAVDAIATTDPIETLDAEVAAFIARETGAIES
jgi:hypothetical protein